MRNLETKELFEALNLKLFLILAILWTVLLSILSSFLGCNYNIQLKL